MVLSLSGFSQSLTNPNTNPIISDLNNDNILDTIFITSS